VFNSPDSDLSSLLSGRSAVAFVSNHVVCDRKHKKMALHEDYPM